MPTRIVEKSGFIRFSPSPIERSQSRATMFFHTHGEHIDHLFALLTELLGVLTETQRGKLRQRLADKGKYCKDCHGE